MNLKLTTTQKNIVDLDSGAFLILAGPGSGKTLVLTERIIRILKKSQNESFKILALTFTNKAASEMRERIFLDGIFDKSRLFVGTFHSFCAEILRNHGSYVGVKSNFEIYSNDEELLSVTDSLLKEDQDFFSEEVSPRTLLNTVLFLESQLCDSFKSLCATFNINEDDCSAQSLSRINLMKKVYNFYTRYIEFMIKNRTLDFNLMILLVVKLFSKYPAIRQLYASTFKYVNVDEFQDTNYAQYQIIKNICSSPFNNIFVVADDDQLIYGWNGASKKRIDSFINDYSAETMQLFENFRCPDEIVIYANNLIQHNLRRHSQKRPIKAMKNKSSSSCFDLSSYNDFNDECLGVISKIKQIKECNPKESVCVIARNNKLIDNIYNLAIKERSFKSIRRERKNDFENKFLQFLFLILRLSNHRNDRILFEHSVSLLQFVLNKSIDTEKILFESDVNGGDFLRALRDSREVDFENNEINESFNNDLVENINFKNFVSKFKKYAKDCILTSDSNSKSENNELDEFYRDLESWNSIERNLFSNIDEQTVSLSRYLQEFTLNSKEGPIDPEVVQFMTIHSAKGKEFDDVFLIGFVNDMLPSFQSLKKGLNSDEMEEERRNCFVAITRTQKKLYISYSSSYFSWKKKPSIFLNEMKGLYKSVDMLRRYACEKVFEDISSFEGFLSAFSSEKILFIIGNGFDLVNGAKSSFANYREYIKHYYYRLYDALNNRIGFDEISLWSDFENQLAFLRDTYKSCNLGSRTSFDSFNNDLILISSELKKSFKDWMNSDDANYRISIPSGTLKLKKIIRKNSFYITFNYTEFLEDPNLYGINSENVLHIHGCRINPTEELMTGFNIPFEYAVRFNTKPDYVNSGVNIGGYHATGVDTSPIANYLHDFSKYAYLREHSHLFYSFQNMIKDCDKVVIIGHSLGLPDRLYFKEIQRMISPNSKWYIGFYSLTDTVYDKDYKENGNKKIQADLISEFIFDLNIKKENISLFRYVD